MDPYRIMGLSPDATDDQVRRAFRKLARTLHPDLNPDDPTASERFREVAAAYRLLVSSSERAAYDAHHVGSKVVPPPEGEPNIFQDSGRKWSRNGEDVLAVADIDFETAVAGGQVPVTVTGPITCGGCGGTGYDRAGSEVVCWTCDGKKTVAYRNRFGESVGTCLTCGGEGTQPSERCALCSGRGTIVGRRMVDVEIEPGVDDGDTMTVAGAGGPGGPGGNPGDLLVVIRVRRHPIFRRIDDDVFVSVPITISEAVAGAVVHVPAPAGPVRLLIPPGTDGGTEFRLAGRGARDGDLIATVRIILPKDPTVLDAMGDLGDGDSIRRIAWELHENSTSAPGSTPESV